MPSSLPQGDGAPADAVLPEGAAEASVGRKFGAYLHVPFCRVRCGYCDFNTYTASDLPGVAQADYADLVAAEMEFAAHSLTLSGVAPRPLNTVFFGGGTPTLLGPKPLAAMIRRLEDVFGFEPGVEITVEANPDSLGQADLAELAEAGVTRLSLGVQSFVPHVLAVLDRTHEPQRVAPVLGWARQAGLAVSLDLIYASPGESSEDWVESLRRAVALEPDHVSAYSLIVEPGTALARRVNRGELQAANEDIQAHYYELADSILGQAGYRWYEVSNWARGDQFRSRHNLHYWSSEDWWGFGPGAHSHIGGVRFWNVKHPAAWAKRVTAGVSAAHGREVLTSGQRRLEMLMLSLRTSRGLALDQLGPRRAPIVATAMARGLVDPQAVLSGTLTLTLPGRLMADYLAREFSESWGEVG